MSAPQRVSTASVREAVAAAGGNVTGAARAVGITKNSLYKRLHSAGVDADALAELRAVTRTARAGARQERRRQNLRPAAVHMSAENLRILREASFDLMAVFRRQMSTADVLELVLEEAFPAWLAARLERKA